MKLSALELLILFTIVEYSQQFPQNMKTLERQGILSLGSCIVVINRLCPDENVNFFLYTEKYPETPEYIRVGVDGYSNISDSSFDPNLPTKVIVHGYNSDMYLKGLAEIRKQYLIRGNYNIFAVDWSPIAQGPCYPAAVWNTRFVGRCGAQLIERIREAGSEDIHLIGFSLGAHVTAFMSNNLTPYKVPRITGLDPAMPGFSTVNNANKLDPTDAIFVDVLHTNAFLQGVVQQSGHVDFYMNGGVVQPGCWAEERFFACNHHRAPYYFAESINTNIGFWGWPCDSYWQYLIGRCPPTEPQIIMGEDVDDQSHGMHLVITDSVSPFAVGRFTGPTIDILLRNHENNRISDNTIYKSKIKTCDDNNNNKAIVNKFPYEGINLYDLAEIFENDMYLLNDTYFSEFDLL